MASPSPLHRLIYFHHETARDAAEVLGISERTLSAWLNGKRQPSTSHLMKLAKLYEINPAHLDTDVGVHEFGLFYSPRPDRSDTDAVFALTTEFLRELGDPERVRRAETKNIPEARRERQKETLKAV